MHGTMNVKSEEEVYKTEVMCLRSIYLCQYIQYLTNAKEPCSAGPDTIVSDNWVAFQRNLHFSS
jgi:hypothetical protein